MSARQARRPGHRAWLGNGGTVAARHILFLGTLDPRKNVGVLLDAYAQLGARRSDAPPLVIAGGLTETGQ